MPRVGQLAEGLDPHTGDSHPCLDQVNDAIGNEWPWIYFVTLILLGSSTLWPAALRAPREKLFQSPSESEK